MNTGRWLSRSTGTVGSSWRHAASTMGKAVVDLIYPPRCAWCEIDVPPEGLGATQISLCDDCRRWLAPPVGGFCLRCGAPADGLASAVEHCGHCNGESFPWERVVALGPYQGELGQAVVRLKRRRNEPLGFALGRLLVESRATALHELRTEIVVPTPMHWLRRIRRGTNGPDLLAEALAKCLELPLVTACLKRKRLTRLQVDVLPGERHVQQRNSFRICGKARVKGRRILLVDDVLTTGSTAAEATKALIDAGAAAVSVAVLARGIGNDAL